MDVLHRSLEAGKECDPKAFTKEFDKATLSIADRTLFELRARSFSPYALAKGVLEAVDAPGGEVSVLDVGCGIGAKIPLYLKMLNVFGVSSVDYHGVDLSGRSIELAQERVSHRQEKDQKFRFTQSDFLQFNTDGEQYDYVFLTAVWHHIPEELEEEAVRKIQSLLKPGGVAMIFNGFYPEQPMVKTMSLLFQRAYRFIETRGALKYKMITVAGTKDAIESSSSLRVRSCFHSNAPGSWLNTQMMVITHP